MHTLFSIRLSFDIVAHVHQIFDSLYIVGNIGITVDGVLDGRTCYRKVDHIHGLEIVHHGIDQAAGKGIATANPVQNVEGE